MSRVVPASGYTHTVSVLHSMKTDGEKERRKRKKNREERAGGWVA